MIFNTTTINCGASIPLGIGGDSQEHGRHFFDGKDRRRSRSLGSSALAGGSSTHYNNVRGLQFHVIAKLDPSTSRPFNFDKRKIMKTNRSAKKRDENKDTEVKRLRGLATRNVFLD